MKVYWTAVNSFRTEESKDHSLQFINYFEPMKTSELLNLFEVNNVEPGQNLKYCPSIRKRVHNSYELRFPFDYELKFKENGDVYSDMYDQKFFNDVVRVRMAKERLISLNLFYWFIPEKSLEMQTTGSYLSDNEFVNKTIAMPGEFNIYNWVRNIEFSFYMKKGYDEVRMNKGDAYLNVKFLTDEPIELVKFYPSDEIINLMQKNLSARTYKTPELANQIGRAHV